MLEAILMDEMFDIPSQKDHKAELVIDLFFVKSKMEKSKFAKLKAA